MDKQIGDREEVGHYHVVAHVDKYRGDFKSEAEAKAAGAELIGTAEEEGNLLVNVGINVKQQLLIGGAGQVYDNSHARIGVGTSSTAATAADTDLGANGVWVAMDGGYPTQAAQVLTFKATFGSAVGNQAWNEWAIDNGSVAHVLLNHKAPVTLGTKSSGETWVLTVTVTDS
jgi:hypothetical protein